MADTGHGASITFATSAFTGELVRVGEIRLTSETHRTSHHGTTGHHTKVRGDLTNVESFEAEFFFDKTAALPTIRGAPEVITIALRNDGSSAATLATAVGGWVSEAGLPEQVTEQLMMMTLTIEVSGGLTFTPEA